MFIIDEIHYQDAPSRYGVLGGGGFFALYGAAIALSTRNPEEASFILDAGSDFPEFVVDQLEGWHTLVVIRRDNTRKTTRGWNKYGENDFREFRYLSPKKRIDIEDLTEYPKLLHSRSFHFICLPQRCAEMAEKLEKRLGISLTSESSPIICWEPIPDLCIPSNLEACRENLPKVAILSPNAEEAARFLGLPEPFEKNKLELLALNFLAYVRSDGCVCLRCGEQGVFLITKSGYKRWFPAYQKVNPHRKIVDCTGAGNTVCGAFTAAWVASQSWFVAGVFGSVAAGMCLEQLGVLSIVGVLDRAVQYLKWIEALDKETKEVYEYIGRINE